MSLKSLSAKWRAAWKKNWYFHLSFFCLLCLYLNADSRLALAIQILYFLLAAAVSSCFAAALSLELLASLKAAPRWNRLLSALSAAGFCLSGRAIFSTLYGNSWMVNAAAERLSCPPGLLLGTVSWLGAVCGFPAALTLFSLFYASLSRTLGTAKLPGSLTAWERRLYPALLLALFLLAAFAFAKSDCFYSGGADGATYNKIYSLDCGIVAEQRGSIYLNLTHPSNILIHPLFAVFSAPFTAIPYLLSLPFSAVPFARPLLTLLPQLLLLFLSYWMLAELLELAPGERALFMVLSLASYPSLLFSVAMEKFILCLFWLVLFLYASRQGTAPSRFALTGAGGTLAFSVFLLPMVTLPSLRREPRRWLAEMTKSALLFLLSIAAFGRADLLAGFYSEGAAHMEYLGLNYPLLYRFQQYTTFVSSCLFAPAAAAGHARRGWDAWWMLPVESVSLIGLGILVLCAVSFWLHRDRYLSRAAAGWIVLSFVFLCLLGWDIMENSLVLFSLYFGWAFLVLLFQLLLRICGRLRRSVLLPSLALLFVLLARNIPQMAALLRFAAEHYPVP